MQDPLIRVVRGNPSDQELSALVAVVLARASSDAAAEDAEPPSLWRDRAAALRAPLMAGPGAWRASALPL